MLSDAIDIEEGKRVRKRVSNYCWKEQSLYFKGLLVPKPEERLSMVSQMHEDLGHVREQKSVGCELGGSISVHWAYRWEGKP